MSRGKSRGGELPRTLGMRPRMTLPSAALRMDMTTSEANAPPKTVIRGCRVAMIAAIRNVLSPADMSARGGQTGRKSAISMTYRSLKRQS